MSEVRYAIRSSNNGTYYSGGFNYTRTLSKTLSGAKKYTTVTEASKDIFRLGAAFGQAQTIDPESLDWTDSFWEIVSIAPSSSYELIGVV